MLDLNGFPQLVSDVTVEQSDWKHSAPYGVQVRYKIAGHSFAFKVLRTYRPTQGFGAPKPLDYELLHELTHKASLGLVKSIEEQLLAGVLASIPEDELVRQAVTGNEVNKFLAKTVLSGARV